MAPVVVASFHLEMVSPRWFPIFQWKDPYSHAHEQYQLDTVEWTIKREDMRLGEDDPGGSMGDWREKDGACGYDHNALYACVKFSNKSSTPLMPTFFSD